MARNNSYSYLPCTLQLSLKVPKACFCSHAPKSIERIASDGSTESCCVCHLVIVRAKGDTHGDGSNDTIHRHLKYLMNGDPAIAGSEQSGLMVYESWEMVVNGQK